VTPEQCLSRKLLNGRYFGEQRLSRGGGGAIEPWQHPAGGALEDLDELGLFDELWDDLDRTRAGADHGDPLAGEVVVVVPAGTVDLVAFIRVEAADVGPFVVRQRPGCHHHGAGLELLAAFGLQSPDALGFVEDQLVDLHSELDLRFQAGIADHVLDVAADLVSWGVGPRP
jgi:hypothetical protein